MPAGAPAPGDDLALPGLLSLSYAVGWDPGTNVADVMVGPRDVSHPDVERDDPITTALPGRSSSAWSGMTEG
jgi:hypothetical protein